jgi:hypothetical protein
VRWRFMIPAFAAVIRDRIVSNGSLTTTGE